MNARLINPLPPGTAFVRAFTAEVMGQTDGESAPLFAEKHYASTPQVKAFFDQGGFPKLEEIHRQKAGVAGASLAGSHYIDDMSPYGIGRDAFALMQSASIFGRLVKDFRRVPFRTTTPREFGAGAGGAWRGEGLPRVLMTTTVDKLQQEVYEATTTFVVSREFARHGAIYEAALRGMFSQALSKFVDAQLLDPSVTSSSARPAAITNGAAAVTSTGSSAAQILADLASLIAAITSPGDSLRWVMRSKTLAYVNAKLASVGYPTSATSLLSIPVIAGSTSPQQIALVDADSILVSHDDAIAADVNAITSIEMVDASSASAITGTGAQMVSMFQVGAVAVKAEMNCAWQPAFVNSGSPTQPAGVAYMTVTY